MTATPRTGDQSADAPVGLREELHRMVAETPPPAPPATTRRALARARTIRSRRRTTAVAVSFAAVAAVAVAVVPGGLLDRGAGTPAPVASAGPSSGPSPSDRPTTASTRSGPLPPLHFQFPDPCVESQVDCKVPDAMVGDGVRLPVTNVGSTTSGLMAASMDIEVGRGPGRLAVAVGNVARDGIRPSGVTVYLDGHRVARFPGGAMHRLDLPDWGAHWVRLDLDGPPTPHSKLTVADYVE